MKEPHVAPKRWVADPWSNLRVRCQVCSKKKRRDFDFCWQCLKEWKGPQPRTDHCDNDGCISEALRTLRTCPDITFESVGGVKGCPSIRACPTCGSLVQHSSKYCKSIVCARCKVKFCFVCLKIMTEYESNLRVRCQVCSKKKRRDFDFCWQCLKEWKGPQTRTDHCDNDGCFSEALRTLRNRQSVVFESVEVRGCPSIRACPTCGSLLEHSSQDSALCLKVSDECLETSTHFELCSDGVAPRQTSIPVWHQ
uniref:RING-type domain-containing protein n=1 Tax=Oryzias latipes TaxID=8090 RepID=A0A3P9H8W6_ORYLA